MHCKTCGGNQLVVAISTENELLMMCEKCKKLVAVISEWPDQTNVHGNDCECDRCKEEQSKISKDMLN
jgi:hypothetical protein